MRRNLLLVAATVSAFGFSGAAHKTALTDAALTSMSADARIAVPGVATGGAKAALVQSALSALSDDVVRMSHPDALRMAFQAYFNYKSAHPDEVRKPYLYFVDYGLDNRTPRGYVFDMQELRLVDGPFIVAHGRGSSAGKDGVPMRFSNAPGAATTSLGLYVTEESYAFSGHAGGLYHSIGLRLKGVSGSFNDAARERGVVMHGAPYVTSTGSGRSQGCPAVEPARAQRLIPKIANGSLVFLFSPNDSRWMKNDPWAVS